MGSLKQLFVDYRIVFTYTAEYIDLLYIAISIGGTEREIENYDTG